MSLRVDDSPGVVLIVSTDDGFSCCYDERKNFMLVECRQMNVRIMFSYQLMRIQSVSLLCLAPEYPGNYFPCLCFC